MLEKYSLFKVLKEILHYNKDFGIREIARKAKVSPSNAKENIDFLASKDILIKNKQENSIRFNLNKNDILVKQIKILNSIVLLKNSGLMQEIQEKIPNLISIILYGSCARGEEDDKSDFDILIISRMHIDKSKLHFKAEFNLNNEVSFLAYSVAEWKEKARLDKVFYDRVIMDGIALYGDKILVI